MTSESHIDSRPGAKAGRCVRPRTDRDLDACVHLLAQVHERDGYPVNWPEDAAEWLARPWFLAAWVAELDGRIAGHVVLSRSTTGDAAPGLLGAWEGVDAEAVTVISRLFVAPWARGHGLGELLMTRAHEEARERGLHLVLDVVASDTAATALYERLGWRPLGTAEQRWGPDQRVSVRCYGAPKAAEGASV
ncbi:GNAT family N-acetyltransferase [Streptomyces sp. NBC_01754]|uniref:GNAT family N-acetyltransferase n=1 Tax=Streptomyces sp. NBC_01754 TaxID=2975930 RepID=UPI002DDAA739|nr:GNAT family N-acetyltransferase [Streptomyces sp. NBC_01754]WSC92662.1 GNAT family N-acetyltransferase [Streptomyces sp. NBC_01754]